MHRQLVAGHHHSGEGALDRLRVERRRPHQQGVQEAAEAPHVGLEAVRAPRRHLGRHEVGRAAHRHVLLLRAREVRRQTEVRDLHLHVLGEEEVRQGHVAVEDVVRVKVLQPLDHLTHDRASLGLAEAVILRPH